MFVGTCTRSKKTPIYKNSCHKTRHRCFKNLETRHCETKIMQLVDHLSKAKLIHKRFAIFFRWGGTLSQLVKSIERPSMFFILQTQHIIYKTTL